MFQDRADAGRKLARAVAEARPEEPVVLALPRGGVPLAAAVAETLGAPLDLVLVRKIGMPRNPELAAGAIVDGPAPTTLFNTEILRAAGLTEADFRDRIVALREEIEARRARYLPGRLPEPVTGRTAILVDDGIATGATIRVAVKALRAQQPKEIWIAVPVAPEELLPRLAHEVDRVICLEAPRDFWAVGAHYQDFSPVE
ncbi:MAG: phosphoribosyltransferase, partial [Pseudodonghicola sp.]